MGVFSDIDSVSPTRGGNYIRPGNYEVEIQRCKLEESRAKKKKRFYIVELRVLQSEQTDPGIVPNPPNTEPAWVVNMDGDYPDLALGNVKGFLMAAYGALALKLGEDPPGEDDITEEMADDSVGEDSLLVGLVVQAEAFNKETASGGNFTRVNWKIPGMD